jgi:hypothetical protein
VVLLRHEFDLAYDSSVSRSMLDRSNTSHTRWSVSKLWSYYLDKSTRSKLSIDVLHSNTNSIKRLCRVIDTIHQSIKGDAKHHSFLLGGLKAIVQAQASKQVSHDSVSMGKISVSDFDGSLDSVSHKEKKRT